MYPKLDLYHDILFLSLRPLRNRETQQNTYKELIIDIKEESYKVQPLFEIKFQKKHTDKSIYYQTLIKNEAIRYYNVVHEFITNSIDDDTKRLWVKTILQNEMSTKLYEVDNEIKRLEYNIENTYSRQSNPLIAEETFVYHYLKTNIILLYLNIQEAFSGYLLCDRLDEEDIYLKFFNEHKPERSFFEKANIITQPLKPIQTKEFNSFKPIRGEVKPLSNLIASYDAILNQTKFSEVESKLYEYEIIDLDYNFKKSKKNSNTLLLAAIYKVLIQNNYFRKRVIGSHNAIKDIDIRKYLDNRYYADTSQQFRKITNEQIENAKVKLPWLDNIRPI